MIFPKRVVIALDLSDDTEEVLYPIRKMAFLKDAEIFFVHIGMSVTYNFAFESGGLTYPVQEDRDLIAKSVVEKMASLQDKIVPYGQTGPVHFFCRFSENQPQAFCDFAKDKGADLLIVAPRKKRGVFESSFAKYVSKHAEANVLLLRPH